MLTFDWAQMEALGAGTRKRWLSKYLVWLVEDFPEQVDASRDVERIEGLAAAAREIGATTSVDIYRVIALSFLPEQIAAPGGAIGRALIDVAVPVHDRLRFIDQVISSHVNWPPAHRA